LARHGRPPAIGRDARWRAEFIAEVDRSGLAGRGGAGFPTARKLHAVASGRDVPGVIANGTEGEPASAKDKVLPARGPPPVAARQAIVVVHDAVREMVDEAAAERRRARLDRVKIKVMTAASGFVAGEASALVNWVGRGIPLPTAVPPRVSERGLRGHPTLVQNVETLAHLALIARHGARWFRSLGTPAEPGSMLITVIGAVRRPGRHEVESGRAVGE